MLATPQPVAFLYYVRFRSAEICDVEILGTTK